MNDIPAFNRRGLLKLGGVGVTGMLLSPSVQAEAQGGPLPPPSPVDTGAVKDGKVTFQEWRGPSEAPSGNPKAPLPPEDRVGFAVVALGRLSLEEILPAFGETKNARLVALVSGSPEKMKTVAARYGIKPEACYDYEGFDAIKDNPAIKAVYVVTPNGLHRDFVERAAKAGKHVLCEKPMSVNSTEARAMLDACNVAGVKLMIAYRIQYEAFNLHLAEKVRTKAYGRLVGMSAINVQTVAENGAEQWRHKKALAGGGALPDIGLYCLNTARFLTGEEPVEIMATQYSPAGDPRFAEVEETVSFTLRFPSHTIVNCLTSYGARDDKHQRLNFERASVDMPNAYKYKGQSLTVIEREGDQTVQKTIDLSANNQFAAEIDHLADCILHDRKPRTPGEEGVQDHVLMEAIYRSAATGAPVRLDPVQGLDAFRGPPAKVDL
ncbi:putative dehydrogenase [Rhizobium sp. PP-F2F-G48]|uniref:Gfo/Idh/MocA family protein n=1 Tax=Rhizobium sp. PP-F2F-G48 TaxID=2135651 RepID=UPI00105280F9|nr:Gfo/Idh/MocA family oxidoreductase [Rhizobium sp. PP-F2F-G48]TCM58135.1 putative dehydrogenase [Rhizobium sp. PP-F2F-G48]